MSQVFYSDAKNQWQNALKSISILNGHPNVQIIKNSIILPLKWYNNNKNFNYQTIGGVCDVHLNFLSGLQRHRKSARGYGACGMSYRPDCKIIKRDEQVIFGGIFSGLFCHLLIDSFSRAWYYIHNSKYKIIFLVHPQNKFIAKYIFDIIGLTEDKYEICESPTQFSEILVPDECIFHLNV